jgi:hypothetical protein
VNAMFDALALLADMPRLRALNLSRPRSSA